MVALGLQSKREITWAKIRIRTAMTARTREQACGLGAGRPMGTCRLTPGRIRTGPRRAGPVGAPAGA